MLQKVKEILGAVFPPRERIPCVLQEVIGFSDHYSLLGRTARTTFRASIGRREVSIEVPNSDLPPDLTKESFPARVTFRDLNEVTKGQFCGFGIKRAQVNNQSSRK